jgi:hypothetical protein
VQHRPGTTEVVLLLGDVPVASWPLEVHGQPDLNLVDRLARLQLRARRVGCSIRLRGTGGDLADLVALVALVGLAEVLVADPIGEDPGTTGPGAPDEKDVAATADLRVEASRQPEGREEIGVEKVGDDADPAV